MHSVASNGGELTPVQLAAGARVAGLDFLATTEHNTCATHGAWTRHLNGDLLVILGQEVVTPTGHWLALGVNPGQLVDWRDSVGDDTIDRHLDEVHRAGGLCVAAHPYAPYPSGTFSYPYRGFDVIEVWNGAWSSDLPWQADNEATLADWSRSLATDIRQGRWRPAIGNSDTHLEDQIGVPHTVVQADELSSDAILAGIRTGRSWIAASDAIKLSFTVSGGLHITGIGETLMLGREPALARIEVYGVPWGIVSFHTQRGRAHHATLPQTGPGIVEWHIDPQDAAFVRVEVRNLNGSMAALSNPILLARDIGA